MTDNLNTKANRAKQYKRGLADAKAFDRTFGHSNELGTEHDNLDRAYRKGWYAIRTGSALTPKAPEFKTSGRYLELLYFHQLTKKEQAELDYVKDDTNSFFRFKGNVYDMGEFARIIPPEFLATEHHPMCLRDYNGDFDNWDCYFSLSAWGGVVARYKRDEGGEIDPEYVCVGTYNT